MTDNNGSSSNDTATGDHLTRRQKARRSYSRTGLCALKAKVKVRGLSALNMRTLAARGLVGWRDSLTADLGGMEALSTQQRSLIDLASKYKLYGDHVDAFLVEQESLINKQRRTIFPVLRERIAIGDALLRCLQALGLERRAREIIDPFRAEMLRQEAEAQPAPTSEGAPGEQQA